MSAAATPVLVAGYVAAVPVTLFAPGFLRLWRRREPALFALAEGGAALVVLGWALKRDAVGAGLNSAWLLGFGAAYVAEGRKRARATAGR